MIRTTSFGLLLCVAVGAAAGPYSGPEDTTNAIDPAIPSASPRFIEWANAIDPTRTAFAPRGSSSISSTGFNSLGDLNAAEIAAGARPGVLTVTFPTGVRDGAGPDFAIFENGFTYPTPALLVAELAYVEVSTDGVAFARFPSISTNTGWSGDFGQGFGGFDSENLFNLAGKHAAGFGTPFDLAALVTDPLVASGAIDLQSIQYVRLVDIPGNGSFVDSLGNPILDAWLTSGTGGFDFRLPVGQGIGVLNAVPEPCAALLALLALPLTPWRRSPAR
jgi:hypothetical protein